MKKRIKWLWLVCLLTVVPISGRAATLLTEGFDNTATLVGSGWTITNNSTAGGTTSYFQGNTGVFSSQSGAPNSYIAANFNNAGFGGNISNWLILPTLTLDSSSSLTFYTQSAGGAADRLEVRFSPNGSSGNVGSTDSSVGDFTSLLLSINPALTAAGYPTAWTQFTVSLASLSLPTNGRLAFRYFVTDTSVNGDYIGIDSVLVTGAGGAGGGSGVPESSSTLVLCMIGVSSVLGASRYHQARQKGGMSNV